MNLKILSYRFAKEIFEHQNFINLYKEIIDACSSCPIFCYPGKSENQTTKDVVQQMMNQYLKLKLTQKGWSAEPNVSSDENESLRGDFQKKIDYTFRQSITSNLEHKEFKVMIEVEFGNAASYYRDLYKFQRAFSYNEADICVLVIPTLHLATRIDSGLADFGKVERELPASLLSTTVPILVIGLENDKNAEFDLTPYMDADTAKSTKKENVKLRDDFLKSVIAHKIDSTQTIQPITENLRLKYYLEEQITKLTEEILHRKKAIDLLPAQIASLEENLIRDPDNEEIKKQLKTYRSSLTRNRNRLSELETDRTEAQQQLEKIVL